MIQKIGKYSIVDKLGEGSKGVLYRAYDNTRSRPVAIRTIVPDRASNQASKEELYRACRSVAKLRHPNVIEIYAMGEETDTTYIAMELLDGNDLGSLIAEHAPIPLEAKLSIMIQVADGLYYAHNNGIVHYSLKPSKIHLTPAGIVKIRDFEVSSIFFPRGAPREPGSEAALYSAPEQILGKECGERADIFAAGVLFYELLTYTHPFSEPQTGPVSENILFQTEIPTVDRFPHLSLGCWPILEACLQKEPEDRFPNMGEVSKAWRELLEDITEASGLMFKELKSAVPLLTVAVERPGSGIRAAKLLRDVQKLVQSNEPPDHLSLQSLMDSLTDHYPLLRSVASEIGTASTPGQTQQSMPVVIPSWIQARIGQNRKFSGATVVAERAPQPCRPESTARAALIEEVETEKEPIPSAPPAIPSRTDISFEPGNSKTAGSLPRHHNLQEGVTPEELLSRIRASIAETRQMVDSCISNEAAEQSIAIQDPYTASEQDRTTAILQSISMDSSPMDQADGEASLVQGTEERSECAVQAQDVAKDQARRSTDAIPEVAETNRALSLTSGMPRVALLMACGILLLLAVFGAQHWIRGVFRARSGVDIQLRTARMSLEQNLFDQTIRVCQQILSTSPKDERAKSLLEQAQEGKRRMNVDTLLKEAQAFISQGRLEESRTPLQTLLKLEPGNAAALLLWDRVKPGTTRAKAEVRSDQELRASIAKASDLINAGKLDQAKAEIDKVLRADPSHEEALALRRQWAAKNSELSSQKARRQKEEMAALRRQETELQWTRLVEGLYKQGKYNEAQAVLDQWLTQIPESTPALALRTQTTEVLRSIQAFELANKERRYDDALSEINKVERMNPRDPGLSELRRRVESRQAVARASLSVYRIGEPAVLTLDNQPIGSNGEVENYSVPAGRHKVAIRNSRGLEAARSQELMDGQSALFVYDANGPVLRAMTNADRDLLHNRRVVEQVHRFPVEHKHMWLRGKCDGDLLISSYEVEYRPKLGPHAFRIPFSSLKLKTEGQRIGLFFAADNKELRILEVQDPEQARTIQGIWEKLQSLKR